MHFLNSTLDRNVAMVTPFLAQVMGVDNWKQIVTSPVVDPNQGVGIFISVILSSPAEF